MLQIPGDFTLFSKGNTQLVWQVFSLKSNAEIVNFFMALRGNLNGNWICYKFGVIPKCFHSYGDQKGTFLSQPNQRVAVYKRGIWPLRGKFQSPKNPIRDEALENSSLIKFVFLLSCQTLYLMFCYVGFWVTSKIRKLQIWFDG